MIWTATSSGDVVPLTELRGDDYDVRRNLVSVLRNKIPVKRTARPCAGGVACCKEVPVRYQHSEKYVGGTGPTAAVVAVAFGLECFPLPPTHLELFREGLCSFLAGTRARSEVVCEFEQVAKVERSHGDGPADGVADVLYAGRSWDISGALLALDGDHSWWWLLCIGGGGGGRGRSDTGGWVLRRRGWCRPG